MEKILNYIDGELRASTTGRWLEVIEPATATSYGQLSDSGNEDLELAVAAAQTATMARRRRKRRARIPRPWAIARLAPAISKKMLRMAKRNHFQNGPSNSQGGTSET